MKSKKRHSAAAGRTTVIGRMTRPESKRVSQFKNSKKAAIIINDSVRFHGAEMSVAVTNGYKHNLYDKGPQVNVMGDRIVKMRESGVEVSVDTFMIRLKVDCRHQPTRPPYSALVGEMRKRELVNFPVMIEYDESGRFVGVLIFREVKSKPATRRVAPITVPLGSIS